MRYYVSWKTAGYHRKDSLKLAHGPVSGCWPSCLVWPLQIYLFVSEANNHKNHLMNIFQQHSFEQLSFIL